MSSKISSRSLAALESLGETAHDDGSLLLDIVLDELHDNPDNPRAHFDEDDIEQLASSIRSEGIIQPLKVRRRAEGGYTILVGHSRKRAAVRAGLERVPAIVKPEDPELSADAARRADMITMYSENERRANLGPLELARHIQKLLALAGNAHGAKGALAKELDVPAAYISRYLALLELPDEIQALAAEKVVVDPVRLASLGALDDDTRAGEVARLRGHTSAQAEDDSKVSTLAVAVADRKKPTAAKRERPTADPNIESLERRIADVLATKVTIKPGMQGPAGKGTLVLHYDNLEVLQGLLEKMGIDPE